MGPDFAGQPLGESHRRPVYETQSPDAVGDPVPAQAGPAHEAGLSPSLVCETVTVDDRAVVTLRGELDLASSPELLRRLQVLITRPVSTLRLDLADLTFIDSSGLGTLCHALEDAEAQGITLGLDRVPDHARRVLEITGLTKRFNLS
jgi:anti-anti-sigma factor